MPDTFHRAPASPATAPRPSPAAKVATVLVGVPLLAALLWVGGWPLFLVSLAALLVGIEEFYRAVRREGICPVRVVGYVCAAGVLAATQFLGDAGMAWRSGTITGCLAAAVLLSMIGQFWRPRGSSVITNTGATVFGVVWVGLLFSFLLRLRLVELSCLPGVPPGGFRDRMGAVSLVLLAVWLQDSAAQLVGRAVGKTKPWPDISPNKTLEGSLGGLLACLLGTTLVGRAYGLPPLHMVALALVMGVLGQLGDLCKSMIKREIGVKDFGSIIPGHGGVLDRFDSLLFAMPVGYLYFRLFVMPLGG